MKQDRVQNVSLPIMCTLTSAELTAMREGLLPSLVASASAREQVAGGFRFQFAPRPDLLKDAAAIIDAEHRCCRFLRFLLLVEPGEGPVWLEVTGPEGTWEFLAGLLDTAAGTAHRE
jgi:hypothetical protein